MANYTYALLGLQYLGALMRKASIDAGARTADPAPSRAKIAAGTAKLGHIVISGLGISIENPEGTRRVDQQHTLPQWAQTITDAHYGYVKRSEGNDGDHVDVFVKPGTDDKHTGPVYVIDQKNKDGAFDEHKCMVGYASCDEARSAYSANYPEGWDVGAITEMSFATFKDWVINGDTTQPVAKAERYRLALLLKGEGNPNHDEKGRFATGSATPVAQSKTERALSSYKPSTKEKQDLATRAEQAIATALGGEHTDDNLPMDVIVRVKGAMIGVEVKSISDNSNNKITMHHESLARKQEWAKVNKATIHTVAVDVRTNRILYRAGVGSFRLANLTPVRDAAHLRQLVGMR